MNDTCDLCGATTVYEDLILKHKVSIRTTKNFCPDFPIDYFLIHKDITVCACCANKIMKFINSLKERDERWISL